MINNKIFCKSGPGMRHLALPTPHSSIDHIRQVEPMCTPIQFVVPQTYMYAGLLYHPLNGISISSVISAQQSSRSCPRHRQTTPLHL